MKTTATFTFTRTKETTDAESKRAEDRASQANQSLVELIQAVFGAVVGSKLPSAPSAPRVADEPEDGRDDEEDGREGEEEEREGNDDLGLPWVEERAFIVNNCMMGEEMEVDSSVLYNAYKSWSINGGEPYLSSRNFATALNDLGFDRKRKKSGGVYAGISLRVDDPLF